MSKKGRKGHWAEYLWIASILYLVLGVWHILFAWLGMICFITPLVISVVVGNKVYCHRYCGRGQLFGKLGKRLSLNRPMPRFMTTKYFRYGFLAFFLIMFCCMLFFTYCVAMGTEHLSEMLTLLWVFKVPFGLSDTGNVTPWVAQYAFGFYSVMVTSTILGLITMVLFTPRSFCVYCPMGTMTQGVCKIKHRGNNNGQDERES